MSKSAVLYGSVLMENFIFCTLTWTSKLPKKYREEENNLFFWKIICFFIQNFWKSLCNLRILYRLVFRCKVLRPFVFLFVWSSIHSIGIFFFAGRKCVDLVVIFNKGREETFAVSLQYRKSCVCIKYLTYLASKYLTTKVDCYEFYVLILHVKCT